MEKENFFARIGTKSNLTDQIKLAKAAGATILANYEAGTVVAEFSENEWHEFMLGEKSKKITLFRAIRKGDKNSPWIISYNTKFYPQN